MGCTYKSCSWLWFISAKGQNSTISKWKRLSLRVKASTHWVQATWSHTATSPGNMCEVLPTREVHQTLGAHGVHWRQLP
jgi:hypothetical protein